jgi:hypothetical protein
MILNYQLNYTPMQHSICTLISLLTPLLTKYFSSDTFLSGHKSFCCNGTAVRGFGVTSKY